MEFVLTPEQMGAADRAAVQAGTTVEQLMERAGRALARSVRDVLGGTYGRRAVIVTGKGNNGGDGLVAARVLAADGIRAEVFPLDPGLDRAALEASLSRSHVAVDAMFGTGLRGALDGDAAWAAAAFDAAGVPVVACDIPSGVDGVTGAISGVAVRADLTVTFAALKPGLVLGGGREHAGSIRVVPIGVDPTAAPGAPAYVLDAADVAALLPERPFESHKWSVGSLLVVGGSPGMLGATNLVAMGALRAGAGMVVVGVPGEEATRRVAGGEAVARALAATQDGRLDEPAAKEVLAALERFTALAVGPGLGTDERTVAAVRRVVAEAPVPLVVDADGLNALAGDLAPLRERTAETVLTPHDGEFARLAGAPPGPDRLAGVRALAVQTGAVVLLKGSTTLVAHPDGRAVVNLNGGPWLATAGTGDVLTGVIAALLAQGLPALEAAALAAWLHGRAADHAGHAGLVAGDLPPALPAVLAALEAERTGV